MADKSSQNASESIAMEGPEAAGNSSANANKRKASSELDSGRQQRLASGDDAEGPGKTTEQTTDGQDEGDAVGGATWPGAPLSKNHLKRLKKQQLYETFKEDRKLKRKDKRHDRQARKRAERDAAVAAAQAAGIDPATVLVPKEPWKPRPVPIAFIIDCDFEEYMRDPEIVSLSSQVVRSYSQNRRAKYQAHLYISSFKGKLKTRFETVLKKTHYNWKNVWVTDADFTGAAALARKTLTGPTAGEVIDIIKPSEAGSSSLVRDEADSTPEAETEDTDVDQSVVYLSSESPYTLERLEAGTTYVIGGLVDRNREKGLCYKRAKEHKVRTAKLPIGEYMAMQSRYVLTTNQVVEIMAKWLECGDWGKAFLDIVPKRKGGILKTQGEGEGEGEGDEADEGADQVAEQAEGSATESVADASESVSAP
ncbi:guanine-1-methyltransferase-domain-containing protein [Cercophora scortea]|uniref:tRNA (guanine(9)-N1)-methyltransferase n=1 Tax=Cercophora scortea TaxID=314031 RepID=A0AAE0M400_9PEZI|nr:guanine-1-methyltransferase-domain-containing protein [Cercophora scortea]